MSSFFLSPSKGVEVFIFIFLKVMGAGAGAGAGAGTDTAAAAAMVVPASGRGTAEVNGEVMVAMRAVICGATGAGDSSVGESSASLMVSSSSLALEKNCARSCLSW